MSKPISETQETITTMDLAKPYLLQLFGLLFFLLPACSTESSNNLEHVAIIPQPVSLAAGTGSFVFNKDTKIILAAKTQRLQQVARFFNQLLKQSAGLELEVTTDSHERNFLFIELTENITHPEGYELQITPEYIWIKAQKAAGAFYAIQTIRQLLPAEIELEQKEEGLVFQLPSLVIKDYPRFDYRGMHLDVGRHFFPVEFIKKYIDLLVLFKMNRFHWHLTEDQGWRIEIPQYPKLQEIAAYRKETVVGHNNDEPRTYDGKKYGGYYTQSEIKEIVFYAARRFITVIPEIELPGHSSAALAAYPELGCSGGPYEVATRWGIFDEVYCPKEETFDFLQTVLAEVFQLFPSEYVHIGGDECPKKSWEESSFCQDLMQREGLKNEEELQSYFIKRMANYVQANGKNIIGWDEILEGGLAPGAVVMSWRGEKGGIAAAKQGHDVIMTPTTYCYFDYYQSKSESEPLAIGGFLPVDSVYSYDPVPAELTAEEAKHILGAQGNLWTEYITTPAQAEYMAFPRAIALAEVVWSPKAAKDFGQFKTRLIQQLPRLDHMNVNYARHILENSK